MPGSVSNLSSGVRSQPDSCSWKCSEWDTQSSSLEASDSPSSVVGSSDEAVCDARSDWARKFNPTAASHPALPQACIFNHVHASLLGQSLSFAHTQLDKLRRLEVLVQEILRELPKLRRELKKKRLQVKGLQKQIVFVGRHRGLATLRKYKATKTVTKVALKSTIFTR